MSKLDKKKAELDNLNTWRNYFVTSLIGLIAFVFTKSDESSIFLLIAIYLAIIFLGLGIVFLQIKIKKLINDIGEL
ncbi:hypothetical protein [Campylobacter avium]|uniref:hypothetical protein n=1 Tax=Campylobacter avium TaxID=522485 RepID=UPI0023549473|nr:hypothetical protein [Campylobacter avium]